jgi:hypothetical protein
MPRQPVAIIGAPAIHDGYRALANQSSSDRAVIRLLAVTYDDLLRNYPCSDEPRGKTGVVIGVLERERDRPAGTPADRCRKRIRSVKELVARRD